MERIKVPLPPLDEQRRIAAWLDSLGEAASLQATYGQLRERDSDAYDAVMELAIEQLTADWDRRRIGELAEFGPKVVIDPASAKFVSMSAVSERGSLVGATDFPADRSVSGYSRFAAGDLLYAKITPCMENGKAALVGSEITAGLGSSEFYVLRPHGVDSQWLLTWLRRRAFRSQAMDSFTGTAGQQRVPAGFLSQAEIPIAPNPDTLRKVQTHLNKIQDAQVKFREALLHRRELRDAVLASALNQVFGS